MSSSSAIIPTTRLDRILLQLRAGLTGLLFAISKESAVEGPPRIGLVLLAIFYDFYQVIQFPLNGSLGWNNVANLNWLGTVFTFRNPFVAASFFSSALQPAIFGILFLALSLFVICAGFAIHGFATGNFRSVRPVQILRATASIVVPLQITIVERLATIFQCGNIVPGYWGTTPLVCSDNVLTLLRVLTVILIACFLAFSVVVTAVFLDRSYGAKSPEARVLGRVEVILVLLRSVLTLLTAGVTASLAIPVLLVSNMTFGLIWTYCYIRFLPDYAPWRNGLFAALGSIICWSTVCAIPASLLPSEDPFRLSLGLVFLVGIPGSSLAGAILVRYRVNSYAAAAQTAHGSNSVLRTPFDVEIAVRMLLQSLGIKPDSKRKGMKKASTKDGPAAALSSSSSMSVLSSGMKRNKIAPYPDDTIVNTNTKVLAVENNVGSFVSHRESFLAADDDDDDEIDFNAEETSSEHEAAKQSALRKSALLFIRGHDLFPQSAVLDLFHANWLKSFPEVISLVDYSDFTREIRRLTRFGQNSSANDGINEELSESVFISKSAAFSALTATSNAPNGVTVQAVCLALIESGLSKQPALDVQFLLIQARHLLEEELDAHLATFQKKRTPKKLGVVESLMVERFLGQLGGATLRALIAEAALWSQALKTEPSAKKMQESIEDLTRSIANAEDSIEQLSRLAPSNVEFLQAHGTFLAQVRRDKKGALARFKEVSIVEVEASKMAAANAEAAAENALVLGDDPTDNESVASGAESRLFPDAEKTPRTSRRSSISLGEETSRLSERSKNMTSSARGLRAVLAQGTLRAQASALEESTVVTTKPVIAVVAKNEIKSTSSDSPTTLTKKTSPTPILKSSMVKLPPITPSSVAPKEPPKLLKEASIGELSTAKKFASLVKTRQQEKMKTAFAGIDEDKASIGSSNTKSSSEASKRLAAVRLANLKTDSGSLTMTGKTRAPPGFRAMNLRTDSESSSLSNTKNQSEAIARSMSGSGSKAFRTSSGGSTGNSNDDLAQGAYMRKESVAILARAAAESSKEAFEEITGESSAAGDTSYEDHGVSDLWTAIKSRAVDKETFYAPLKLYTRASLVFFILCFCAGIIGVQLQSSRLLLSTDELLISSDRVSLTERMNRRVVMAALLTAGLVSPAENRLNASFMIAGLKGDAEILSAYNKVLYASSTSGGLADEISLYVSPKIHLSLQKTSGNSTSNKGTTSKATSSTLGLGDTMTLLASRASAISQYYALPNAPNFSLSYTDSFFIAKNVPYPIRYSLNEATWLIARRAQILANNVLLAAYISFGVFLVVVIGAFFLFIFPQLISALNLIESSGALLVQMPSESVKNLFFGVLRHFMVLRRAAGGDSAFRALVNQHGGPGSEELVVSWLSEHAKSLFKVNFNRALTSLKKNNMLATLKSNNNTNNTATPMNQATGLVKSSAAQYREDLSSDEESSRSKSILRTCFQKKKRSSSRRVVLSGLCFRKRNTAQVHRVHNICLRRAEVTICFGWPFFAFIVYVAAMFGYTVAVILRVKSTLALAVSIAATRASVAATNSDSRFLVVEGVSSSLWLDPDDGSRPLIPPACNFSARSSAFETVTHDAESAIQHNIFALTGEWVYSFSRDSSHRAVFPSPEFANSESFSIPAMPEDTSEDLHRILRENACATVASGQLNGMVFIAPNADPSSLGLPPLDCQGLSLTPSLSTVSTGGYRGLGMGGLTTVAEYVALRSWISSSFTTNSSSISSDGTCYVPDFDSFSSVEWSLDAAQWLLVDPGLRVSVLLSLSSAKSQLSLLLTVHALMALALPIIAIILYALYLSPKFASADSEAKMARAVLLLLPRKSLSEVKDFEWLVGRKTISATDGSGSFSNLREMFEDL